MKFKIFRVKVEQESSPRLAHAPQIALILALLMLCAGCGLNNRRVEDAGGPSFESISITATALNGRIWRGGILMVSHATGAVSVCWTKCETIGHTGPSGPHDLVLTDGGNLRVYLENVATGHVEVCNMESDDEMTEFKAGRCIEVGYAAH